MSRGELRLVLPMLGSDALFAGLFAEYRRRHPNIAINLLEGGSRSIEQGHTTCHEESRDSQAESRHL